MNKRNDFTDNKKYKSDDIISKGYAIYDEWLAKKLSSRKIVNSVNNAVSNVEKESTITARLSALSYLFALDVRVKERYNTILRCIFLYFSWRREVNALKSLNVTLNIANVDDIRTAIEIELQRLREKMDYEASDDGDDEVSGGKRNGRAEEDVVSNNQRQQNNTQNQKNEDISENESSEEYVEEKNDNVIEQNTTEEQLETVNEKKENIPDTREEKEPEVKSDADKSQETLIDQPSKEDNGRQEMSEQNIDNIKTDINNYINTNEEKISFEDSNNRTESIDVIDNAIIDNNSAENKKNVNSNSLIDIINDERTRDNQNTVSEQKQEDNSSEKNAYLYDNMLNNFKDGTEKNLENLSQPKTDAAKLQSKEQLKTSTKEQLKSNSKEQLKAKSKESLKTDSKGQTKTHLKEQTKVQSRSKTDAQRIKNDFKNLRIPIKINLNNATENDVRSSVGENMTSESIEAIKNYQSDVMREQLSILSNELEIDAKGKIIEKNEPLEIKQSDVKLNRK